MAAKQQKTAEKAKADVLAKQQEKADLETKRAAHSNALEAPLSPDDTVDATEGQTGVDAAETPENGQDVALDPIFAGEDALSEEEKQAVENDVQGQLDALFDRVGDLERAVRKLREAKRVGVAKGIDGLGKIEDL